MPTDKTPPVDPPVDAPVPESVAAPGPPAVEPETAEPDLDMAERLNFARVMDGYRPPLLETPGGEG